MCEKNGVFSAPAESRCADLQFRGWEWRRGGAESRDEVKYARFANAGTAPDEPRDHVGHCFQGVKRLVEDRCEPGSGLHDFVC